MSPELTPPVTVVVVARNEAAKIGQCMASLAAQSYPGAMQVILVDDGSTDGTAEIARGVVPALRVIENHARSISANRNIGWRAAETQFVAYLDADCIAPSGWIGALVAAMAESRAAAVGGPNVPPSGESRFYDALAIALDSYAGARDSLQGRQLAGPRAVPHIPSLNVMYRVSALETVGGFDERFARVGEDEDLSRRLGDLGLTLYAVPEAVVVHRQRSGYGAWARNMRTYGRGRTWLIRRHPNAWSPAFLIPGASLLLLPLYLPAIALYALGLCLRRSRLDLTGNVALIFIATHLPYAVGQFEAMGMPGDTPAAIRARRTGLVVLKNAGNKGDEAIFVSVAERLAERAAADPASALYVVGLGPSGFDVRPIPEGAEARARLALDICAARPDARAVRPLRLMGDALRALLVVARFRAIVISGGQWLHDLSLPRHAAISALFGIARLCGTRTGVFCIGAGPLRRRISQWLLRRGFGPRSLMILRDDRSCALIREAGLAHAERGADPAIELTSPAREITDAIAVVPCAWAEFENIYDQDAERIDIQKAAWIALIDRIAASGRPVRIIPTMNPEDAHFAETLRARLAEPDRVSILRTEQLLPCEVQAEIGACRALVSMRLHPVIFASNLGVPFVALNYANKVRSYCDHAGLGDWVVSIEGGAWLEPAWEILARHLAAPEPRVPKPEGRRELEQKLSMGYAMFETWLGMPAAWTEER